TTMFRSVVFAGPHCDHLLASTLTPVGKELRLALVSKRVIKHLVNDLERHGGDVSTHACSFNGMNRVANTCCQHLCLPTVVAIDLNDVTQQQQPILANIIQPPEEGTNERGSGLRREDCLRCGKAKRNVDFDPFAVELVSCC